MESQLLFIGVIGWLAAQGAKVLLHYIEVGKLRPKLLFSSGGMPSAHSSLVSALTAGLFRYNGIDSPIFQVTLFMSLIVMHDAMGVRRQAGEHAKALNSIIGENTKPPFAANGKATQLYKEMIGHTPAQVVFGAILGTLVGLLLPTL